MDAQGSSLPVTRETTLAETVDVAEYAASINLAHRPPSPADCELVDRDMLAGFSSPHTALRTDDQVAVAELGSGDSVRRSEPYDALVGIDRALADGCRLLTFSFHSPTLEPGHTPYVRTARDREMFDRWWDSVFERLARHGVTATTISEVLATADRMSG